MDAITDYARGDIVDVSQVLGLAAGVNPVSGGYLRVTTTGLIQVDVNGGGDAWTTLSTVNGSSSVTLRYLSGGVATYLSVASVVGAAANAFDEDLTAELQVVGRYDQPELLI